MNNFKHKTFNLILTIVGVLYFVLGLIFIEVGGLVFLPGERNFLVVSAAFVSIGAFASIFKYRIGNIFLILGSLTGAVLFLKDINLVRTVDLGLIITIAIILLPLILCSYLLWRGKHART